MKEKYEDLILRIVSKNYPYIKKIVFKTMVDDPDLTVTIHVDTDMISPQSKDDDEPHDYVHHLFNYPYNKVISDDSFRLDELLYKITSPLSKLLVTENTTVFNTGSFTQYVKYEREI
tara:strand:- start:39 stop:389 length:351 start_codon:yes stop_codon:yes gene_type:complete